MTPPVADDPHSHELPLDAGLLDRYFAGDATAEECEVVRCWVSGHPDRAAHLDALRRAPSGSAPPPPLDVDTFWTTVQARTTAVPAPIAPRIRKAATHRHRWPRGVGGANMGRRAAISASVMLGVGIAIGVGRRGAGSAVTGHEYVTAPGQRLSVMLVDGTRLTLAPTSRLRLAADYGSGNGGREVELEGEAYLTVVHDAAHPFAVRTYGVVARDLGTAFDVRAYPGDAGTRIAVTEGAVAVSKETQQDSCLHSPLSPLLSREACGAQVRAGDVATVEQGRVAVEHRGDVSAYTAWMQGGLVFKDTPLAEVARDIARTFDLRVSIVDSELAMRPVTARFGGESVDDVLDEVTYVVGGRYERSGQQVVIRRRAGHADRPREPASLEQLRTARAGSIRQ